MIQQLSLYPDTFLWLKGDAGLMYNAKHFTVLEFRVYPEIRKWCEELLDLSNLYTIRIDPAGLSGEAASFVSAILSHRCGVLSPENAPVISLPPLLNIQKDINRISRDKNRGAGEDLLKYFTTLTIQTGGPYKENRYYRQTVYPVHSDVVLSPSALEKILREYHTPYLGRINLVMNHPEQILLYPDQLEILRQSDSSVYLYLPAGRVTFGEIRPYIEQGIHVKLIQDDPEDLSGNTFLNHPNVSYVFMVRNRAEYEQYTRLTTQYPEGAHEIIPIFENNLDFFHEFVFLSKADLLKTALKKREVFAHQAVNTNFFGNLIVMPTGDVHSSPNTPPLGDISESIYELILRELQQNHSWRVIRDKKPCADCVWQWLCPSPSGYEYATGRNHLCTLQ